MTASTTLERSAARFRDNERDLLSVLAERLPQIAAEAPANDEHATLPEGQLRWLI